MWWNPCCLPVCRSRLRLQVFQLFSLFHLSTQSNFHSVKVSFYPYNTFSPNPIMNLAQFHSTLLLFSLIFTQPHFYANPFHHDMTFNDWQFRGPVKKMKDHQGECTFKKEGRKMMLVMVHYSRKMVLVMMQYMMVLLLLFQWLSGCCLIGNWGSTGMQDERTTIQQLWKVIFPLILLENGQWTLHNSCSCCCCKTQNIF